MHGLQLRSNFYNLKLPYIFALSGNVVTVGMHEEMKTLSTHALQEKLTAQHIATTFQVYSDCYKSAVVILHGLSYTICL